MHVFLCILCECVQLTQPRAMSVHYFICTLCLSGHLAFIAFTSSSSWHLPHFALTASKPTTCWQLVSHLQTVTHSWPLTRLLHSPAPFRCRYGAAPQPPDGGASVIIALLDKLIENGRNYSYELVMCLKILLRNVTMIEMPFKVSSGVGEIMVG